MSTITLYRKSNLMLMGRKFKIYIDDQFFDNISDGEEKRIEIPPNSKELTVKIMNYESKPIILNSQDAESYIIKQNLISMITTYIMIILAAIFFVTKFALAQKQPIFLYMAMPFLLVSIYYSTFGRRNVILMEKTSQMAPTKSKKI